MVYRHSAMVRHLGLALCAVWPTAAAALAAKALQRRRSLAQGAKERLGCFRAPTAEHVHPEGLVGVHRLRGGLAQVLLPRRITGGRLLPAGLALAGDSGRCRSSRSNPVDVPYSSPFSRTGRRTFTRPRQGSHSAMKRLASAKEGANNARQPRAGQKAVLVPV